MTAITDYASLTTAIGDWSERTYASTRTDQFIALAEAEFALMLRNYRREETATITTNSSGVASLPSDFLKVRSLTRDYSGAVPLIPAGWQSLINQNAYGESGEPIWFAISEGSVKVAPIAEDDFTLVYEAKLTALSSGNTTNWLITLAPQAYLYMCLATQEAFEKNFQEAAVWKAQAMEKLHDIGVLSDTAQYGNAEMTLDMVTP